MTTETTKPMDDELFELIKPVWLSAKPSVDAQQIRATISTEIDSGKYQERDLDYIPTYVWDLIDIAAQRGIDYGKL